jgi:hypothetical protein
MEEILNSNESMSEVVDTQTTEQSNETVQTNNAEVVETQQETKVEQTKEENANYAKIRREAEAKAEVKARDSVISEMYGQSHGIHTYADYQKALQEQEMKDKGVDPETVKKYVEEHPDVKAAREYRQNQEKEAKQKAEFVEFFNKFPDVKPDSIPAEVWAENAKGVPLRYAYADYALQQQKADADKAKANETNAKSSMGSVNTNGNTDPGYISSDEFEKNRGNQEWVNKNYAKIQSSRAKW